MKSFVPNADNSAFSLANLPYGVCSDAADPSPRPGVRIGDHVLDLRAVETAGLLRNTTLGQERVFDASTLIHFMSKPHTAWRSVRTRLQALLAADNPELRDNAALREKSLIPLSRVQMHLPVEIGDYTDFYSSRHHAFNVGTMFRGPENALMPNYLHIPVGYHGRASTVVLSGTPIRRPSGQTKADADPAPKFGPSQRLDFELEMGVFLGGPDNALGEPIPMDRVEERLFGMVILNDWSARDIQAWEYQPLGPFLSKNFATSISPWIVPFEALAPFRVAPPAQEPKPFAYLLRERDVAEQPAAGWSYDIALEVALATAKQPLPQTICRSNHRHLYWTVAQQLAHHSITGCRMRPGDLLGSGTISGPTEDSYGSMLELAWRGTKPIKMQSGEERRFLHDGDSVVMSASCRSSDGQTRIGFGECVGTIVPARG